MQEGSARHPFLMLAWVGVDYLVEELLTAQVTIEDKFRRSLGSPPHTIETATDRIIFEQGEGRE
jgi:hypothetical protein